MEFGRIDRELYIDASPEIVFDVVSNPKHVSQWWPDEATYEAVPGVGVIHGQSFYFGNKKTQMGNMLRSGAKPRDVIDALVKANAKRTPNPASPVYDGGYQNLQRRQYLIARVGSGVPAAGFTGTSDEAVVGTPKARADYQTYALAAAESELLDAALEQTPKEFAATMQYAVA